MKNKYFTIGLIIVATIAEFLGTPMIASADFRPVPRQLCDLAIFPFNLSGTKHFGDDSTNFINGRATEFPGGTITDAICNLALGGHLAVPTGTPYITQSYWNQPVTDTGDIPLKAGTENAYVPIGLHVHNYYNDSFEETSGQQYFYKSLISKFAIDFAPDVASNIDLSKIACITDIPKGYGGDLTPIADCDGYIADLWGGTTVTKSPQGVVWSFGVNIGQGNRKPRIFGNNPDLDKITGGFDSSLEINRQFFAYVQLPTREDLTSTLWSSTTTSRVLIRDFAIKKTTDPYKYYDDNYCPASDPGNYDQYWCSLDNQRPFNFATEVPVNSTKASYWFPIGTTSVVWRKPATPVTLPPPVTCTDLTLTPATLSSPAPAATPMTATVTTSDGKSHVADILWSTAGGTMAGGNNQSGTSGLPISNTFNLTGTNGDVNVKVTKISDGVTIPPGGVCENGKSINTPPIPGAPICADLKFAQSGQTLRVRPVKTDASSIGTAQWSENGDGKLELRGPFASGCPATIDETGSTPVKTPAVCEYEYTQSNPGSGSVEIKAVPDDKIPACTKILSYSNGVTPPGEQCKNLTVAYPPHVPGPVCVKPDVAVPGYDWTLNGAPQGNHSDCQNIGPGDVWSVVAQANPVCNANGSVPLPPLPPQPPTLIKTVRAVNLPEAKAGEKGGSVPLTLIPSLEGKLVEYKLIFEPHGPYPTTGHIVDDMSKGYIQGVTNTGEDGGRIVYNDNLNVSIPHCGPVKEKCFEGDIGNPGGIILYEVNNAVIITYQGRVTGSLLTKDNCTGNRSNVCQEKYPNTARAKFEVYDSAKNIILSSVRPLEASALVQSFCQYILTRAAGDIYLETDLNFGKDINLCSEFKSSTGLIVTPNPAPPQKTPSTGKNETVAIGHEICSQGQAGTLSSGLEKLYGKDAASKNLSSQICEVKLRPGQSWTKSQITSSIKENVARLARWEPNLNSQVSALSTFEDLNLLFGNSTNVYHKTNGDLTLGGFGQDLTLNDGQGTKTFIIEHGNLIIKDNIKYGACNKPSGICTARDTASLAFIVLDGHVEIAKGVTEVSGVFFVQKGDKAESGKLKALGGEDSFEKLTIYGSVYGDIQDLFEHRKFAGDPAANDGSVVIRFDERIILNTPPGLQDLLQLTQKQVA